MSPPELLNPLPEGLLPIIDGAHRFLRETYRETDGLFPFSSRRREGVLVNDYEHPQTIRYTINTLLGLHAAATAGATQIGNDEVHAMLEAFLRHHYAGLRDQADLGLLTLLLSESGYDNDRTCDTLSRLSAGLARRGAPLLNVQDLAWTIWGAVAASGRGIELGEQVARRAYAVVRERYVHERSGLPRHSIRHYRRNVVSFGSLVYFLRAMHEVSRGLGDAEAGILFERGVQRAIDFQGPRGEWPWMIDVPSGRSSDFYPVFSVHQDSMAMLFLLPALAAGHVRVEAAIRRSWEWVLGRNELGTRFYEDDPFVAYRSIERVEHFPRARRYARTLRRSLAGGSAPFPEKTRVRVNPECRSYHLGWILYVWSSSAARRELWLNDAQGPTLEPSRTARAR